MSLKYQAALSLAVVAATELAWSTAHAGVFKNIGADVGAGAVEKIKPALAATIADVDARVLRHEDRIGSIVSGVLRKTDVVVEQRLDQVDGILEARLLQLQIATNDVTSQALGRVDDLAKNRLTQAGLIASNLVTELSQGAQSALETANTIIEGRIADVGKEVHGALNRTDELLSARLAQADEIAERRLGNVDVIASKQRIALERTAVRIAMLVALVAFVLFVGKRLWTNYQDLIRPEQSARARLAAGVRNADPCQPMKRGTERTLMFIRGLGVPFVGHVALAVAVTGALFVVYDHLPFSAQIETAALVTSHRQRLEESLARFEFDRLRYHASQLEYLAPDDGSFRALAAKGELLRDVFERPTLWATTEGLARLFERVKRIERLLDGRPDPDLLVLHAVRLWRTGSTRREEHQAASLCARALRLGRRTFALAPVARAYIEAFLRSPYVDSDAGFARDAEAVTDLAALVKSSPPEPSHPLSTRLELWQLMGRVDIDSSRAYIAMAMKQADLTELLRTGDATDIESARNERNRLAGAVVEAWCRFDEALVTSPTLSGTPNVLDVFRLNDAFYTRAKWFLDHPETNQPAPLLASVPAALGRKGKATRATLLTARLMQAPPRVVWMRRFRALVAGPALQLIELQESNRFRETERLAQEFELGLAGATPSSKFAAALSAARLGLYLDKDGPGTSRMPLARALYPLPAKAPDENRQLEDALLVRGAQLL